MSTYSPSLRIELITTGDQAGTWGNTTNTNLGGLVESAIAGYTSVSITSANQALTALNGAPDESRNMTIALTTTTTAAFNVYAPPAEKTYVIYNASSYAATLYNSTVLGNTTAAGTGVVIPAGKTTTVWSDGTNFAAQVNYLPSLTLGSAVTLAAQIGALMYPVGSIYTNATDATNPGTLLGFGTWTAFGAGRVPVGFDSGNALFNTAEETGGSYDATLPSHTHTGTTAGQSADHSHSGTTANAGAHVHGLATPYGAGAAPSNQGNIGAPTVQQGTGGQTTVLDRTDTQGTHAHSFSTGGVSANHDHAFTTASSGSSATNANIQPYITVYMWKRTA
jgi:hypothetical protein